MTTEDLPLSLFGTNGDVIDFHRWVGDFIGLTGARGFGVPPQVLTMLEGAGDGATVRNVRAGARDLDLPIGIFGENRGDILEKQRRLRAALRWDPASGEPPAQLRFRLFGGEVFEIGVHYVAGAETQIGETGTDYYCRWLLTLRCPDPYWVALDEISFRLRSGSGGRGLLPRLANLRVSSSQVLGSVTVNNPGDVPAPIKWIVTGPGGPFSAVSSLGETLTFDTTLGSGEVITIDGETALVTDQTGENRYGELGDAPKLFSAQPGISTIDVLLPSATADSRVVGLFRPRRELVY